MKDRLWDILAAAGLLLVAVGLAAIYWPLGLLALGGACLFLGLWGARLFAGGRRRRREEDDDA